MVGGEFTSMPSNIHILYFNCGDGGYEGGGGGGGGRDLHASHRPLRANYIINSRPPAITASDSRRREARKSASERFIVQQNRTESSFIYMYLLAVFLFYLMCFHHSMLIRRHRSRQSYRPRKDNKRKSYQLIGM